MKLICFLTAAALVAGHAAPLTAQAPAGAPPGTTLAAAARASVPGTAGTIQGNAVTASYRPLANTVIQLRDAHYGRTIDSQTTDTSGLFTFRGLDPGSYIVEIVGDDNAILATSELIHVNGSDVVSALVKLPDRRLAAAVPFRRAYAALGAVVAAAGAASVLAIKPAGEQKCRTPEG